MTDILREYDAPPFEHAPIIERIIESYLKEPVMRIERMKTGLCNEVYAVTLSSETVIVRLNSDPALMDGSEVNIPLFSSLGISVPRIIASDYSKRMVPFAFQILTRIPGKDMGAVIDQLTDDQLRAIGKKVADLTRKLRAIPTTGKFGWVGDGSSKLYDTWLEVLEKMRREIVERDQRTHVVGETYLSLFDRVIDQHRVYFTNVPSELYYDDMCTKNLLVDHGTFSGIVDLDTVANGDPLEAIGRIEASWFGTHHGSVYTDAIEQELNLSSEQREVVTAYALMNRIYWLSENGIQFNQNSSTTIDENNVIASKKMIDLIAQRLHL